MHPGQALLHYRKAVIAGSILAPASLVLSALAQTVPLSQGPNSLWAAALAALGPTSTVAFWILFSLGVTFLPIGLFFVGTSAYGRRELAVHVAWVLLCAVATPIFTASVDHVQHQVLAETIMPKTLPLVSHVAIHAQQHKRAPMSLDDIGAVAPNYGLRVAPRLRYEVHGPAAHHWRLKMSMPGSLGDKEFVFLPFSEIRCNVGVWHQL